MLRTDEEVGSAFEVGALEWSRFSTLVDLGGFGISPWRDLVGRRLVQSCDEARGGGLREE